MPEKIVLDCDPGHDDAIAILLAAASPAIELLAVTTVSGNHDVEHTARNALSTCAAYGIEVPVARGSARPMVRDQVLAVEIHGETGLDGPELPAATFELDERHAVDLIVDTVMEHEPGTLTLVPVGPLTNIALAARREPRIVERVKGVMCMGGELTAATSPGGGVQHLRRPARGGRRPPGGLAGDGVRSRPSPRRSTKPASATWSWTRWSG
ncbi:hypothetical protein BJF80_08435 [Serinicoccus sp. CUA-874]|uniref:nucleoside hydrolase n=1 Tax=Serinicoccus sp. CUA-874 TaxID=1517939 RepID=UPI000964367F|nr:nucleoside hydrolase [Serinicoccus sp. CUA-874]OLT15971.1 hypothetical protein BJF80_08435 [Serinicoccus sp. CUA-874]